jgi:Ca2+-binding RTX toxin-like protein
MGVIVRDGYESVSEAYRFTVTGSQFGLDENPNYYAFFGLGEPGAPERLTEFSLGGDVIVDLPLKGETELFRARAYGDIGATFGLEISAELEAGAGGAAGDGRPGSLDAELPYRLSYAVPVGDALPPAGEQLALLFSQAEQPGGSFRTLFPTITFDMNVIAELEVLLALELGLPDEFETYTILDFLAGTSISLVSLDTGRKTPEGDANPLEVLGVNSPELIELAEEKSGGKVTAATNDEDELIGVTIPFNKFLGSDKAKEKEKAKTETEEGDTKADEQDDPPDPDGLDLGEMRILIPSINTVSKYDAGRKLYVTDPSRKLDEDGKIVSAIDPNDPLVAGNRDNVVVVDLDLDGILTYATGGSFPPLEYKLGREESLGPATMSAEFAYNLLDVELRAALPLEQEFTLEPRMFSTVRFFQKNADGSKGDPKEVDIAHVKKVLTFVDSATFQSQAVADRLRAIAEESVSDRPAEDVALFVDFAAGIPASFTGQTASIGGRVVMSEDGGATWSGLFAGDVVGESAPAFGRDQSVEIDLSGKMFGYEIYRDDTPGADDEIVPLDLDLGSPLFRQSEQTVFKRVAETPAVEDLSALNILYDDAETYVEVTHQPKPYVTNRTGLEFDLSLLLEGLALDAALSVDVDFGPLSLGGGFDLDLGPLFSQRFPLFNAELVDFFNDGFDLVDEQAAHVQSFVLGAAAGTPDYGDAITGTELADPTVPGTAGDDTILGLAGDDRIEAGDGDDTLMGGRGSDTLIGGQGYDLADFGDLPFWVDGAGALRGVEYFATEFTLFEDAPQQEGVKARGDDKATDVMAGIEHVRLTDYADRIVIHLDSGDWDEPRYSRLIESLGGDDTAVIAADAALVGLGPFELRLGEGDDDLTYTRAGASDVDLSGWRFDGGEGRDLLWLEGADFDLSDAKGAAGEAFTGFEDVRISSKAGDAFALTGDAGDNKLIGGGGDETIRGGGGDDTLIAYDIDNGSGPGERNVLMGGPGADLLQGGAGIDTADYSEAATSVYIDLGATASAGRGYRGEAQGDVLEAIENVTGSDHDDILIGDDAANLLDGGEGDDRIMGSRTAGGAYRHDTLRGGAGDDLLTKTTAIPGRTVEAKNYGTFYDGGAGFDVVAVDVWQPFTQTGTNTGKAQYTYITGGHFSSSTSTKTSDITVHHRYERSAYVDVTLAEDGSGLIRYIEDNPSDRILATRIEGTATYSYRPTGSFLDPFPGYKTKTSKFNNDITDQSYRALDNDSISFTKSGNKNNGSGKVTEPGSVNPAHGQFATESFAGIEGIIASRGNDRLTGNDQANALFGNGGSDLIRAGGGDDRLGFGEGQALTDVFSFPGDGPRGPSGTGGGPVYKDLEQRLVYLNPEGTQSVGGTTDWTPVGKIEVGSGRYQDIGSFLWGQGGVDTLDMRFDRGISFFPDRSANYAVVDLDVASASAPVNTYTGERIVYGRATWYDADDDRLSFATTYGVENVIGTNADDTIRGDAGDNVIEGLGGADHAYGEAGYDTFGYALSDHGIEARFNDFEYGPFRMDNRAYADDTTDSWADFAIGFERYVGSDHDDLFETRTTDTTQPFATFDGPLAGYGAMTVSEPDDAPVTFEMGRGADTFRGSAFAPQIVEMGAGADRAIVFGSNMDLSLGEGDDTVEAYGTFRAMAPGLEAARTVEIEGGEGLDTVVFAHELRSLTVTADGVRIEIDQQFDVFEAEEIDAGVFGPGERASAAIREQAQAAAAPTIYLLSGVEVLDVDGKVMRLDGADPVLGPDRTMTVGEDEVDAFALDVTPPADEAGALYRVVSLPDGADVEQADGTVLRVGDLFTHAGLGKLMVRPGQTYGEGTESFVYGPARLPGQPAPPLSAGAVLEGQERVATLPLEPARPGVAMGLQMPADPLGGPLAITVTEVPTTGEVVAMRPDPALQALGLTVLRAQALAVGDALTAEEVAGLRFVPEEDASGPAGGFAYSAATATGLRPDPALGSLAGGAASLSARDGTATQRIALNVTPVDDAPRIDRLLLPVSPGGEIVGTLRAADPEGDPFTLHLAKAPALGTLRVDPDGGFVYRQAAEIDFDGAAFLDDSFSVVGRQAGGGPVSTRQEQTVRIIAPEALAPVVFDPEDKDTYYNDDGTPIALGGLGTDDLIVGHDGPDELYGFGGHDRIDGGPGDDTLSGGLGRDVFVKRPFESDDVITDFERGSDRIDVAAYGIAFEEIGFEPRAEGLLVRLGGDSILLEGVDDERLGRADFEGLGPSILETGTVELYHKARVVELGRSFDDPVAFAWVASEAGLDAVNVRIEEVEGDALRLRLQEPDHLDGRHGLETVHWMVVEAGTWVLPDGTVLEAGTLQSGRLSPQGFEQVGFEARFDAAPVVLSQVQTIAGGSFVTTRQRDADADGFAITMQEEEAQIASGHAPETLGWLAVEAGSGSTGGADGFEWAAGRATGVDHAGAVVETGMDLAAGGVVAQLSSYVGADPAWARGDGLAGPTGFRVSAEEDASADAETLHAPETVDWFAFSREGTLMAYDPDAFL